jgi:carboxyvinyl-carboxyphosphonate phosphorylmutase
MSARARREAFRAVLAGGGVERPASVYDAISARIAEDLGFAVGILGGSAASLAILGEPDLVLITLSELAEQVRRITRAGRLPVMVDADHGYGNALNVHRTVAELEAAGAAALTIEDTALPQAYGEDRPQLISLAEGVGKMKAAIAGRSDPALVIFGRTGAAAISSLSDAITRARAYEAAGVDGLFFTGLKRREEVTAVAQATTLPLMLGSVDGDLDDDAFLAAHRVRIANQGHAPIAAATQAVYATLKALRDGTRPRQLAGLPPAELTRQVMRESEIRARIAEWLGGQP